ncbi:hypothetical protein [Spiroplasma endosymbiont of Megaselia nigra]|uniref:hypothetical protein n=1 Tax=Spiroplasma endosymbiont of Megaselia nigra TaxID=2478537 RepID=UPI000F88CA7D|nr:hypothetical protein [Spiroplasma endosymbiont of Megaselia nigra]RUO86882.1 hypothetical protein D9R21_00580 [Spiroplasma endosymbiont of Megaselia nigra]
MMLSLSPQHISYLSILIFGIILGTIFLIIWIFQKKRLVNSGDYYSKNNKNLDLWNYIKRNIALYSAFFCYVISISALFLLVL